MLDLDEVRLIRERAASFVILSSFCRARLLAMESARLKKEAFNPRLDNHFVESSQHSSTPK